MSSSSSSSLLSVAAEEAIRHLKILKPLDGWSIEKVESKGFRLLRRNVALTDNYFLDIHYEATPELGAVVGILSKNDTKSGRAQAQVLVDRNGQIIGRKMTLVTVHTYGKHSTTSTGSRSASTATTASTNNNNNTQQILTDEQNMQLIKYGARAVAVLCCVRLLTQTISGILIIAIPLLFLFLIPTCPSNASFDTKKELKRVMRGYHLPDDDPNKPKGFLNETLARINATVTTEIGTFLRTIYYVWWC